MSKRRWFFTVFILFLSPHLLPGEEKEAWQFSAEASLYLLPHDHYGSPVMSADRSRLHLEGRFNYEDRNTASVFAGYNFKTGQTVEIGLTPMIGGVFGNSNGVAPGFLFSMDYKKLSISSEGEYFFSTGSKDSNFFYSWSEFTYSPVEWFWIGAAGQRTRAYQTNVDVQRGLLVGVGMWNLAITGYAMDLDTNDPYGIVVIGYEF